MVAQRKKGPRAGTSSKSAGAGRAGRDETVADDVQGEALDDGAEQSGAPHVPPPVTQDSVQQTADGDTSEPVNNSLDDVLALMVREVQRLQEALEYYRLSEHPDKDAIIRWHVQQIDQRQDRLADLKALMLAERDDLEH